MLLISAYNKHTSGLSGFTGYVSGACGAGLPNGCPNEGNGLVHDLGSILNFIEYAFRTGGNFLTLPGAPTWGISPTYPYADYWAPDAKNACPTCAYPYSLSDFFNNNIWGSPQPFPGPISAPYPPSTFENWGAGDGNVISPPDVD